LVDSDLRSKTFLGPAKPDDYVIRSIPHPYDPNADQSLIRKFLQTLFPEGVYDDPVPIQEFFQMHMGSFLTKKTVMPAVLLCIGEGSNGKSAYNQIISKGLGKDYHATIAAEALQKEPGTNNDNLYRARHARCATIMEVERGKKLNAKMLKNLTGGDETEFSAKFIKGTCEQTNIKMHIFANDSPEFTAKLSDDFGLARRIAIVPFRAQFLDDNDTAQREKLSLSGCSHWAFPKNEALITEVISNGIPGLLAFMVDGASRLLAQDSEDLKLKLPDTIRTATHQEKVEDLDELVRFFVEEHLERAHGCPGPCCKEKTFISTYEITAVYKKLGRKESCLFKDSVFQTKLKIVIDDVFKTQEEEDLKVWYGKKKGVPSPDGKKEMRGYHNLEWKEGSAGRLEANILKQTYKNA
jgi:phage/plasmid-associated DNA primase